MTTHITIDAAGRVVLPKGLREALALEPGDRLELERAGERITLRPVRHVAPLAKEKGVWVFRTGEPLAATVTDEVLSSSRTERDYFSE